MSAAVNEMLAASPRTAAVLRNALVGVEQSMLQDPFEQDDLIAPHNQEAQVPERLTRLRAKPKMAVFEQEVSDLKAKFVLALAHLCGW
eukprot:m.21044 g.21044  ORF g.21044 m.21044 type:complete len:88 (+) comp11087_c0_seq4:231-494(+)